MSDELAEIRGRLLTEDGEDRLDRLEEDIGMVADTMAVWQAAVEEKLRLMEQILGLRSGSDNTTH